MVAQGILVPFVQVRILAGQLCHASRRQQQREAVCVSLLHHGFVAALTDRTFVHPIYTGAGRLPGAVSRTLPVQAFIYPVSHPPHDQCSDRQVYRQRALFAN